MKIVQAYPPNYDEIVKHLPGVKNKPTIIFTYGDTVYCPKYSSLPADIIAHEEVHILQQQQMGGPEIWWEKYLSNKQFRLGQELQAYQRQILWLKVNASRVIFRQTFRKILKVLAGPAYGHMISKEEAKKVLLGEV